MLTVILISNHDLARSSNSGIPTTVTTPLFISHVHDGVQVQQGVKIGSVIKSANTETKKLQDGLSDLTYQSTVIHSTI